MAIKLWSLKTFNAFQGSDGYNHTATLHKAVIISYLIIINSEEVEVEIVMHAFSKT